VTTRPKTTWGTAVLLLMLSATLSAQGLKYPTPGIICSENNRYFEIVPKK
jgi:hypothetical protein